MPIRLAILGVDPVQREWLDAVATLAADNTIELVGIGHRTLALARDTADIFGQRRVPAFDDLRLLLKEAAPQVILLDRPSNATLDFLRVCIDQNIGFLSLGPPIENFAEAQTLAEVLEPRTNLLYIWPRFADSQAYRRCTQADEFVRPIKFAVAAWFGMNHVLAKTASAGPQGNPEIPVRSLTVLAWDALSTLIGLIGLPSSVYATIRGTMGSGNSFADISGSAALTLRFPEETAASVSLSDRIPPPERRDLLLLGQTGTVNLETDGYDFRDAEGKIIDSANAAQPNATTHAEASSHPLFHSPSPPVVGPLETLREYLHHFVQPATPHRGWEHRLEEIAATMEAMIVSHRTGQAESPERFRGLRR